MTYATGSATLALSGIISWSPVLPGPIAYAVAMPPEMVDNGQIQYFAAMGFTVCYLIAKESDTADTYGTELAAIKALGMTPILDISKECGDYFNNGTFNIYETWFTNLAAAGWQYVAFEAGIVSTDIAVELAKYFLGYYYYFADEVDFTFTGYTAGNYVYGLFLEQNCTANTMWLVHDDMPNRALEEIIESAYPLGIPNGFMALASSNGNAIWSNSISGTTPSTDGTTGNTYQSMIDWSFQSGMPVSCMAIYFQPSTSAMLDIYFGMWFDQIFNNLMQTYPPANTNVLISPTVRAVNLTMSSIQSGDNVIFNGNVRDLVSGAPVSGLTINLQKSTDNSSFSNTGVAQVSDAAGNFSWSITLTSGTYYFREYFSGTASYNYAYGPWGHTTSVGAGDGTKIIAP